MEASVFKLPNVEAPVGVHALNERVFGSDLNEGLVHQILTAYRAKMRQGSRGTLSRANVSMSKAKLWRQKGTGRARVGSGSDHTRRGGGDAFKKEPRDYSQKVMKKMYRAAMRSILSEQYRQGRLLLVEDVAMEAPKTKAFLSLVGDMSKQPLLIVTENLSENLYLACRNCHNVYVTDAAGIDPLTVSHVDRVLVTQASADQLQEWLG